MDTPLRPREMAARDVSRGRFEVFPSKVAQEIRDRSRKLLIWTEQRSNDLDGRTNVDGQPCDIVAAGSVHRTVPDNGLWEDAAMVALR